MPRRMQKSGFTAFFLAFFWVGVKRITDTAASAEVCHKYQKAAVNHVGLKSEEA